MLKTPNSVRNVALLDTGLEGKVPWQRLPGSRDTKNFIGTRVVRREMSKRGHGGNTDRLSLLGIGHDLGGGSGVGHRLMTVGARR